MLEYFQLTAPFQEGSSQYIPIIYIGITAISFFMNSSYEKARIESENEMLKMNEQFVSTAKLSALGQMASGIAHEINNPLAVIQGKAQQIQYRINQGAFTIEQTKKDANKIEQTVDRIAKIIQGLRTFSRNAEQDPIQPTRLDSIVSETFELCSERFKNNQINLTVECPNELRADCRAAQISQVFMNLLLNSFDAVELLQDKWVKLVVEQIGTEIQISVTDSGAGIKEDVRRKMMEPFFTTKPVGKGTGLGLSICRGIIEGHGGRFEYDSSSVNTRFKITIPQTLVDQKNNKKIA
jgi:C4-dicarboxylate-specific signal transduction histidine kinase